MSRELLASAGVPAAPPPAWSSLAAAAGALLATALCVLTPQWADEQAGLVVLAAVGPALLLAWLRRAATGGWALMALAVAVAGGSDLALRAEADDGGAIDLQSAAKLGLWLLGGVLLAAQPAAWARLRQSPALLALALFFVWGVLGSPGSATPVYSVAAALGGMGVLALALVMAERLNPQQALRAWLLALALPVAASLLRGQLDPTAAMTAMDGGAQLRLSGWFGSPNNLGRAAALLLLIAVLAVVAARPEARGRGIVMLMLAAGIAVPALWQSESRGALLALLAALLWTAFAPRPAWAAAAFAVIVALLAAMASWPWLADDLALSVSRSGRLEEVLSLTGRTEIWAASLDLAAQAPWLGHGFATSRELLPLAWQGAHGWTTTSAHNLWLQAALGGGLVAVGLLVLGQLAWVSDALRRPRPEADAVVVFVLVLGLLEASAAGPSINSLSFALAWALALGARRG